MTENPAPNQAGADKPLKILSVAMTALMSALELAHMTLHRWNNEIFVSITRLDGTVKGLFLEQKA
jgi:hypothetical protein